MQSYLTETPLRIRDITLIPVVRIQLQSNYNAMTRWCVANKEPVAIIICDSEGTRAFDMSSNEVSMSFLSNKVPHIETILLSHRCRQTA